jgi:hypothetical protein
VPGVDFESQLADAPAWPLSPSRSHAGNPVLFSKPVFAASDPILVGSYYKGVTVGLGFG